MQEFESVVLSKTETSEGFVCNDDLSPTKIFELRKFRSSIGLGTRMWQFRHIPLKDSVSLSSTCLTN